MATNFSNRRDVTVTITGAPMPLDAYKAVYKKVEEFEDKYYNSLNESGTSEGLTNITAASAVLTGTTAYKVYAFTVTTVYATGTYTFAFIEAAPNVESLTPEEEVEE